MTNNKKAAKKIILTLLGIQFLTYIIRQIIVANSSEITEKVTAHLLTIGFFNKIAGIILCLYLIPTIIVFYLKKGKDNEPGKQEIRSAKYCFFGPLIIICLSLLQVIFTNILFPTDIGINQVFMLFFGLYGLIGTIGLIFGTPAAIILTIMGYADKKNIQTK